MKNKVGWMVVALTIVGFVPFEDLRIWMNNKVSLVAYRIIIRSLSALIIVHNEEYQPKNCGFCVANHTSPIDVAILSTDCTYSLVRIEGIFSYQLHAFFRGKIIFSNF